MQPVSVLFVCLGNICRSPTAHGVFQHMLNEHQLQHQVLVDSAGTGDWHIGKAPDGRAQQTARQRGFDISPLRARQINQTDFENFDFILAMDKHNLADLKAMQPDRFKGYLGLFLDFAPHQPLKEVPDPYYGGEEGFNQVFDLVTSASQGLLEHLSARLSG
jgi:protein-tyrosine phosphatase